MQDRKIGAAVETNACVAFYEVLFLETENFETESFVTRQRSFC